LVVVRCGPLLSVEGSAMRTFVQGSGPERKLCALEVEGTRLKIYQKKAEGTTKKFVKELGDETEARAEAERMVGDLRARGYVEQSSSSSRPKKAGSASSASSGSLQAADISSSAYDDVEPAGPVLGRLATAPAASAAETGKAKAKKAGGKKKKKKQAANPDGLDKRVLAGIGAVCLGVAGFLGYMAYDVFLKPPSIVGTWAGSMMEFEIGHPIVRTAYQLVLDDKQHASMTLQEKYTSTGTYTVQGNRLKLALKPEPLKGEEKEDGEDGAGAKFEPETETREYKISLGRVTLDLYDPETGKQVVQLLRFREPPVVASGSAAKQGKDLAVGPIGEPDKAADAQLATVEFAPKDTAFRLRHPAGWEVETGSRPDNSYSWANITKGSAKILVSADVQGSLISGSDTAGQFEEGSPLAPVHRAHEHHLKAVASGYSDYKESDPTLFKGAGLGEGRIAVYNATESGLLGGKLRGYRVTLLTNDRRITLLCECPPGEFEKFKPTFLAVCRSVAR
jgi:hypothetical protein